MKEMATIFFVLLLAVAISIGGGLGIIAVLGPWGIGVLILIVLVVVLSGGGKKKP